MGTEAIIANWLALVGGVSGLALLVYFGLMVHFARKKERDIQELKVSVARIEGLLLGRKTK